jgi:hypothetical protein
MPDPISVFPRRVFAVAHIRPTDTLKLYFSHKECTCQDRTRGF